MKYMLLSFVLLLPACMQMLSTVEESAIPLSKAEAPANITASGAFPTTASNIYFAVASVGTGGRLKMYRFDAPVDDIIQHAYAEASNHWSEVSITVTNVTQESFDHDHFQRAYYVKDLKWFDIESITDGFKLRTGDAPSYPRMWIDKERGRFYLLMSD
jgi:hypothetical protein